MNNFIPNIDDANVRIDQLEKELAIARQANAPADKAAEAVRESNARMEGSGGNAPVEPLRVVGMARAQAANAGHKTHIELPKTELFGLRRAMAANAKQQPALAAQTA